MIKNQGSKSNLGSGPRTLALPDDPDGPGGGRGRAPQGPAARHHALGIYMLSIIYIMLYVIYNRCINYMYVLTRHQALQIYPLEVSCFLYFYIFSLRLVCLFL